MGAGLARLTKSTITTIYPGLVERASRYTKLVAMDGSDSATDFAQSLTATYQELPEWLLGSLTWDQGSEMADQDTFSDNRPRKYLGWKTPTRHLATLAETHLVATTP